MALPILLITSLASVAAATEPAQNIEGLQRIQRIINGRNAHVGQFPHQALVFGDGMTPCGGSLISRVSVLTAAHCTVEFKMFVIRLGGIHLVGYEASSWTVTATLAVTHPRYDQFGHIRNDVAVIYLPVEAPLTNYIKLVALPSLYEVYESFEGQNAILSGWGWTSEGPFISEILQWTPLRVISNEECQLHYKAGWIIPSVLCTVDYYQTSGGCFGDSGSALVIKTSNGFKQVGVVSFGPLDCDTETPSVYTRVTSFLAWIAKPI